MATLQLAAPSTHVGNMMHEQPVDEEVQTLPTSLHGPLVWVGEDFAESDYILHVTESDVQELDAALSHFKGLGLGEDRVSVDTFPLKELKVKLQKAALELHQGRGFTVIRGLDASHYEAEDSVKIFLGISSYVADHRGRQDKKGNMLSHITSSKLWTVPMDQRHGIHSDSALPFHNDMGCDILALQARHTAEKGGLTFLSSAWTVFNKLLAKEPEVAKALLTPNWPVQISGKEAPYYLAPAFAIQEGKLMTSMDPNRFGPHPSFTGSPKPPSLTAFQIHALERVSAVAYESELGLRLEQGDLLFFNNWALLHRRDAYRDGEETSRHLVRLWLRNSQLGWAVPSSMLPPWVAAYGPAESDGARVYALHPSKEYKKPKYTAGSAAFIIEDTEDAAERQSGA
ncbi:Taurine hydroxylase-like protein SAT17 [Paramyrothecium foliicola]|nr:Taurine hydroxylase-like protein SAT17 [Paramyrothecium foliicola]